MMGSYFLSFVELRSTGQPKAAVPTKTIPHRLCTFLWACSVRRYNFPLMTLGNSEEYRVGIRHFNGREFYDAHEVWEDVWRESHGMEKQFLQGLIQAAVALHHHSTGNVVGACSLMARARRNLDACPEEFGEIRLGELRGALGEWRAAVVAGESKPRLPVIVGVE
jgi:hypothetical protein